MYTHEFDYYDEKTEKEYEAEADTKVTFERNWGSDADGNRGTPRHFAEFEALRLYDIDNDYELINEKGNKELYDRAEKFYIDSEMEKAEDKAVEEYENED